MTLSTCSRPETGDDADTRQEESNQLFTLLEFQHYNVAGTDQASRNGHESSSSIARPAVWADQTLEFAAIYDLLETLCAKLTRPVR